MGGRESDRVRANVRERVSVSVDGGVLLFFVDSDGVFFVGRLVLGAPSRRQKAASKGQGISVPLTATTTTITIATTTTTTTTARTGFNSTKLQ